MQVYPEYPERKEETVKMVLTVKQEFLVKTVLQVSKVHEDHEDSLEFKDQPVDRD
jgi:hypothetical protein